MATLTDLLANLGGYFLEVVVAPRGLDLDVSDVIVYDAAGPFEVCEGDLVLGIGVTDKGLSSMVGEIGRAGAVGAVVKSPQPVAEALIQEAAAAGIALLSTPWRASWGQVMTQIRSMLFDGLNHVPREDLADLEAGDLFAVANSVAALVGGPILIQDPKLQVLAYSNRQEEADLPRHKTILERGVSASRMRYLNETGILRRLFVEHDPILFEDVLPGRKPRLGVGLRAGHEILGVMSAVLNELPTDEKIRAFGSSAKVVALHILRQRLVRDAERHTRIDLVESLLVGKPYPIDAADRLGIGGEAHRVMAVWICAEGEDVDVAESQKQLWDAVEVYLSVFHIRAASALLGSVVHVIMASETNPEQGRDHALRIARDFVARSAVSLGFPTIVGIGGHASSLQELSRSCREAGQVMKTLREVKPVEGTVAEIDEVRTSVLVNELREVVDDKLDFVDERLAKLRAHDAKRGTGYLETLRVFLESFGDVGSSAKMLNVHPNTLRHRIRRVQDISGIRLGNPDERLVVMLRLRMSRPHRSLLQ